MATEKTKKKIEPELKPQKILKYYNKIATAKGFVTDIKMGSVSNIQTPPFKKGIWVLSCPHCENELVFYEIEREELKKEGE